MLVMFAFKNKNVLQISKRAELGQSALAFFNLRFT